MTDTTSTRPQCQKHDFIYADSVEDYPHVNYDHAFMKARFRRCTACGLEEYRDWGARASPPQPTAGSTGAKDDVQDWLCRVYGLWNRSSTHAP